MKKNRIVFITITVFLLSLKAFASGTGGASLTHNMMLLVFQIGIILFFARMGGKLFEKINMPGVLGELMAGVLIGPYLLGAIALPGFPHGIFGDFAAQFLSLHGTAPLLPISTELYGFATIASIMLLFLAGLETDISLFLRFSLPGFVIGICGVAASFFAGALAGKYILGIALSDPQALFLGVMSTATSVGITARILSEKKKMDTPEGVTILAAAVVDDVLGIIILAIIVGIAGTMGAGTTDSMQWMTIGKIALKAVVVWLGFTVVGILLADKISNFLKKMKNKSMIPIMAFGLAMIIAGIFEQAGLAMIIGAYIVGLSLSKTDLNHLIQEKLHIMHDFFVPIFFVVMGMMVDLRVFLENEILIFGLIYSVVAVISKYVGGALPSFLFKFNRTGASRVGLGMIPRGEVALIIAGIGLSSGILDQKIFGASIMMTLLTTLIAPPLLSRSFSNDKNGSKVEALKTDVVDTAFNFNSQELTEFLLTKITKTFSEEGFFVNQIDIQNRIYSIRKETTFINLLVKKSGLVLQSHSDAVRLVKNIVYEALLSITNEMGNFKDMVNRKKIRKELAEDLKSHKLKLDFSKIIDENLIEIELKSNSKDEVLKELLDIAGKSGKVKNYEEALTDLVNREKMMSTGLQKGIALPHAKTEAVDEMIVVIGIKKDGVSFDSIDGKPSQFFAMILSPKGASGPYMQFLAALGSILNDDSLLQQMINCEDKSKLANYLNLEYKKITKKKS